MNEPKDEPKYEPPHEDRYPAMDQHDVRPDGGRRDFRLVRAWGLVLIWAAVVWSLGSDDLSAAKTAGFLRPLLQFFMPELTTLELYRILVVIRKSAHVIEYAILAILLFRALVLGKRPTIATCAALALAIVVTFAAADETRQGFSAARTGSGFDVLLDASGGILAIGLLLLLRFYRPKTEDESQRMVTR